MPQAIWSLSLFVLEYIAKKNPSDPRREGRQDRIKEGRNRKKELVHRYIYSSNNLFMLIIPSIRFVSVSFFATKKKIRN